MLLMTQREDTNRHGSAISSIEEDYISYFESLGYTILLVPNTTKHIETYAERASAMVFTGGGEVTGVSHRDRIESALIEHAITNGIPLLGICRGMQMINHHFGGRAVPVEGHVRTEHIVNTPDGEMMVNSYHELGISAEGLGTGLVAWAHDPHGFVEALRHTEHRITGIMWHPERSKNHQELVRKALS